MRCFNSTTLTKNIYIPFAYENSEYTPTYNSFIAAGYDELGTQHGVYLKDINAPSFTLDYGLVNAISTNTRSAGAVTDSNITFSFDAGTII